MPATNRSANSILKWATVLTLAFAIMLCIAPGVRAQNDDAGKILKAMSDYMTSQKTISVSYDSGIEVITSDLQKIQFNSSGKMLLHRPNGLWAKRTGGYADVELVFDGKSVTIFDKAHNVYVQTNAAGSVDQLFDKLRNQYAIEAPGADLLVSHPFNQLMDGVIDAKYIGPAVVEGVECQHLAFRNQDTDWQIWIEAGAKPIPRKYVITSKAVTAAPQYTLLIRDWKTDVPAGADAFAFKAPAGAKKVEFKQLPHIDEVPLGVSEQAKKGDRQ